jgi:PAS domain S-box-containing protein
VLESTEALAGGIILYQELFHHIGTGVAIYEARDDGEDFLFVDINPAGEKLSRVKKEEVVGRSILEMFPAVREMGLFDLLRQVWKTGTPDRLPTLEYRDDRISQWVENYVFKIPSGELVAVFEDTTLRRQMESALEDSLRFVETLMDSIPAPVFCNDQDGVYLGCNQAFAEAMGRSKEEIRGRGVFDITEAKMAKNSREMDEELFRRGGVQAYEHPVRYADGSLHDIVFRKALFTHADGRPAGIVGVMLDISDLREAEKGLRQSENKFFTAFHLNPNPMAITDVKTAVLADMNEAFVTWSGYSREDAYGRSTFDLGLWVDPEERRQFTRELEAGDVILNRPIRMQIKGGNIRQMLFTARFIDMDPGTFLLTMAIDITEQTALAEQLAQSETRFRSIFEHAPFGIALLDLEGRPYMTNPAVHKMLGYTAAEIARMRFSDFTHPDDVEVGRTLFAELLRGQRNFYSVEKRYLHKDGRIVWARLDTTMIRDAAGRPISALGMTTDITDRKRADEELRRSEQHYRALVETTHDLVYTTDRRGFIAYVNPMLSRLLGYAGDELLGKPFTDILAPEYADFARNSFRKAMRGSPIRIYEAEMLRKDGTQFRVEFNTATLTDADGKLTGRMGIGRDVTERRKMEQALRDGEDELSAIYENAPLILMLIDDRWKVHKANTFASRLTGKSPGELIDLRCGEALCCLHALDVPEGCGHGPSCPDCALRLMTLETIETGLSHHDAEVNMRLSDRGKEREATFLISTKRLLIRREPLALVSIQDITDRKAAEKALEASVKFQDSLIDSLQDGFSALNSEGVHIIVNDSFCAMTGFTREELIVTWLPHPYWPPEEREAIEATLQEVTRSGSKEFELTFMRKSGERFPVIVTPSSISDEKGNIVLYATIKDITERKRTEEALRESEDRYRSVVATVGEGVIVQEVSGKILAWNRYAEDVFGLKAEEVLGRTSVDYPWATIHEDGTHYPGELHPSMVTLRTGKACSDEIMGIRKAGGSVRWVSINTRPMFREGETAPHAVVISFSDITEKRQAEQALKESEERYRNIFESALLGIFQRIPGGGYKGVNPAYAGMFGYASPDEMIAAVTDPGNQIYVRPQERLELQEILEKKGIIRNRELEMRRRDGTNFWISLNARVVRSEDGNLLYYEGTVLDITERKRTEQAHKESEERYRSIFDNAVEGIFQSTPEGRFIRVNPAYARIFGYDSPEEMVEAVSDIASQLYVNPEDRERTLQILDKDGVIKNFECPVRRKDGSIICVSINSRFGRTPEGIPCYEGFILDVTERKQVEKALRERDNRFRKLSRHVPGMIYQFLRRPDGTYCVPFTTEAIRDIFGCSPEDVREDFSPIARVIVPEDLDQVVESIESSAEHLTTWQFEYRVQLPAQSVRWMIGRATPEALADGGILWHGFNTDITERRQIMEELLRSREEMRALAGRLRDVREEERKRIARAIHDEMGQALTGIKMDLGWVRRQMAENGEIDRGKIRARLESMGDLADVTIREMRRIITELRPGVLDDLGLVAALEWLVQDFRTRTGGECTFHPPAEEIEVDPDRAIAIFRIAQEAMTNIIRHSGAKRATLTLRTEEGGLLLQVIDDGRGFYEADAQKRGAYGLLGMKERALAIGGTVDIQSMPGFGTWVNVRIPVNHPDRGEEKS